MVGLGGLNVSLCDQSNSWEKDGTSSFTLSGFETLTQKNNS